MREALMEQASASGTREAQMERPKDYWNARSANGMPEGLLELREAHILTLKCVNFVNFVNFL